jgi:hypothetical protein
MDADARNRIFEEGRAAGFAEGREVGQREGLPFAGVDPFPPYHPGAKFEFETSWVESFLSYERLLTACLPRVEAARFLEKGRRGEADELTLVGAQEKIESELQSVRWAVDAEVERGLGPPRVTEALRGPPRRPKGVREYLDLDSFVEEDRRRAIHGWPGQRDAGGFDGGVHWRLERPIRRWETTTWRISWLGHDTGGYEPTNEVYALESGPPDSVRSDPQRVWLLGSMTNWDEVMAVLLPLYAVMDERNSLIAAAKAISAASPLQLPREVDY